jgi:hypothetical protein
MNTLALIAKSSDSLALAIVVIVLIVGVVLWAMNRPDDVPAELPPPIEPKETEPQPKVEGLPSAPDYGPSISGEQLLGSLLLIVAVVCVGFALLMDVSVGDYNNVGLLNERLCFVIGGGFAMMSGLFLVTRK